MLSKPLTAPTMNNTNEPRNTNVNTHKPVWVKGETRPFLDDFIRIKQLGIAGQYGVTYQCVRKSDNKSFAVKYLNKNRFSNMPSKYVYLYLESMLNEINSLNILNHDNIVHLECIYEDMTTLYIVMEECKGGELFDRILKRKRYSENDAKYVIKQLLSALRYIHDDKGIIHGDLKPDNILFADKNEKSRLKIIDFGMSKYVQRLKYAINICGTLHYMAPEITVKNLKYNHSVDMWSVGIILYVMIYGYPPFYVNPNKYGDGEQKYKEAVYAKIQNGFEAKVKSTAKYGYGAWFPDHIKTSQKVQDLIGKLLEKDMDKRYTAKEALTHPWFGNMDKKDEIEMESILMSRLLRYNKDDPYKLVFSTIFRNEFYQKRTEHYEQLIQLFSKYDIDGDGIWSFQEFEAMIESMKYINIDKKYINTIYTRLASLPSNGITFYDLLNALVYDYIISSDGRISAVFKWLDINNNGQITINQLKQKLCQINPFGAWNKAIKLIEAQCVDPNGGIFYDELLLKLHPKWIPEWIPHLFMKIPSKKQW